MFDVVAVAEPEGPEKATDPNDARSTDKVRGADRRPRRIALVVDDSEDAQEFCRDVLEDEGFWVQTARDGREALDQLLILPTPAIIILDLLMPRMDGHELLDVIRAYRRLAEVPVLIITASGDASCSEPRTEVLHKPLSCESLAMRVKALLGESLH